MLILFNQEFQNMCKEVVAIAHRYQTKTIGSEHLLLALLKTPSLQPLFQDASIPVERFAKILELAVKKYYGRQEHDAKKEIKTIENKSSLNLDDANNKQLSSCKLGEEKNSLQQQATAKHLAKTDANHNYSGTSLVIAPHGFLATTKIVRRVLLQSLLAHGFKDEVTTELIHKLKGTDYSDQNFRDALNQSQKEQSNKEQSNKEQDKKEQDKKNLSEENVNVQLLANVLMSKINLVPDDIKILENTASSNKNIVIIRAIDVLYVLSQMNQTYGAYLLAAVGVNGYKISRVMEQSNASIKKMLAVGNLSSQNTNGAEQNLAEAFATYHSLPVTFFHVYQHVLLNKEHIEAIVKKQCQRLRNEAPITSRDSADNETAARVFNGKKHSQEQIKENNNNNAIEAASQKQRLETNLDQAQIKENQHSSQKNELNSSDLDYEKISMDNFAEAMLVQQLDELERDIFDNYSTLEEKDYTKEDKKENKATFSLSIKTNPGEDDIYKHLGEKLPVSRNDGEQELDEDGENDCEFSADMSMYCKDLLAVAQSEKQPSLIGRGQEVANLIHILCRQKNVTPC